MKRTAVNWLIDKLEREYNSFPWLNSEACIKAQEKEKEQTIEFLRWFDMQSPIVKSKYTFTELYDKFYQETFNDK